MSDLRPARRTMAPFYLNFFLILFDSCEIREHTHIAPDKVSAGEFASCVLYKQLYAFDNL